jgi:hypothetical protein
VGRRRTALRAAWRPASLRPTFGIPIKSSTTG